ncbi:hypothetical protein EQG63_08825 [Flavobacterium amnicola]|uniref:TonB-dependent receptor plug domain-containing protein n=1 Tax=Flavobacterium amnicola TaxID=2506422 RepID=A0A4Q1K1A9_9FLAO|nr:hypothetical protein [Flavobacterium amnicola]RXR18361.1 hypothetical protein EQG63_08825 [Flavobacterium amnicola]
MEHQDNLFEQFKKAADTSETKDFPGMEKVWSRVDAKLDTQVYVEQKGTNTSWKKFAIAASVVVGTMFAYQFLKEEEKTIPTPQNTVVVNDSISSAIENDSTAIVAAQNESPLDKVKAEKVLEIQLNNPTPVAVNEISAATMEEKVEAAASPMEAPSKDKKEDDSFSKGQMYGAVGVKQAKAAEEVADLRQDSESKKQVARKAAPLVVVDGKATDKKVSDIQNSEDLETIVELKNPLYIINGVEYTEKEMFGPNPSSPYYPLNKQEIESITIYQDDEAIERYGEKAKNGVVIVKTKNGKPIKSTR